MAVLHGYRSPMSVAIVGQTSSRTYTSIYAWLDEIGIPAVVVGMHASIGAFLDRCGSDATSRVDLVVVPREDGAEQFDELALRKICSSRHRVVVFGSSLRDEVILECLDAGVWAFIAGERRRLGYPAVTLRSAAELTPLAADRTPPSVQLPGLTSRESEVLVAWCHSTTKGDVAERLAIERATVSSHLQRIRAKYAAVGRSASTKAALIARAIQDGLVDVYEL